MGKSSAPRRSPSAATEPAQTGPYKIAAATTGINARLILSIGVAIERNRESTTSIAISSPKVAIRLMLYFKALLLYSK